MNLPPPGSRRGSRVLARLLLATMALACLVARPAGAAPAAPAYDWLQFDGDPQHSGANSRETILSPFNVGALQPIIRVGLPDVADGAPVFLADVPTPSGTKDLLFATTRDGHIVALDAHSASSTPIWSHQYPANGCQIDHGPAPCFTTSSPAIDPDRDYVYSYGLDGNVHKYQVGDGSEVTGGGWPEPATLKAEDEKGSSALGIATDTASGTSYLYVASSGYPGDQGDYQGHLTTINLATGAQAVFNAVCSGQPIHFVEAPGGPGDCPQVQAAIWARPGVVDDPDTNRIYSVTGNGPFDPSGGDWGDTVLALNPDGTGSNGQPLDSYTPADQDDLDQHDLDLGSTAPAILPVPASAYPTATYRHLALQGGKDGLLRLINLDDLSGQGGAGHTGGEVGTPIAVPQGGGILTQPAVWQDAAGATWVFVANGNGITGLKLTVANGVPRLVPAWPGNGSVGVGGTSPIVANGVLYDATYADRIVALDPTTGALLWQGSIGPIHWESPIVADGVLYLTDEDANLTAFSLPPGGLGPYRSYLPLVRSGLPLVNQGGDTRTLPGGGRSTNSGPAGKPIRPVRR